MAADRTPNELADAHQTKADRLSEASTQTAWRDEIGAELIAEAEFHAETASVLRRQGEQLDTLRKAIGDPDELRRIAVSVARDRKVTSAEAERRIGILTALAAAVPQDPERCACGKPATGTVGGVPTCGDDR